MVFSVNEVPDGGTADSIINDISCELQSLRDTAHALNLPNADKINWTLFQSSSSDSAATQKKFNRLIEEKRDDGPVCSEEEAIDVVENFCAMHLGVNLRKAFWQTVSENDTCSSRSRDYPKADVLVHEFCKKHGIPEYGLGVLQFPSKF